MNKSKQSLLLLPFLPMFVGSAIAGTFSVTTQTQSKEGLTGVTTVQTSNTIKYTIGAAYAEQDSITFTFNADVVSNTTFPSQINVAAVDNADPTMAIAGMALGILGTTDTTVSYRVTTVSQPDDTEGDGGTPYTDKTTLGAAIELGTISYTSTSLEAGDVTVSVSSKTSSGGSLDTDATATVANWKTQFGSAAITSMFDAVLDVATVRTAFVTDTSDAVTWSITNPDTTNWVNLVTMDATNGTVVTVKGETGKLSGLNSSQFTVGNGGTVTYTEASDQVAINYSGDVTTDTLTFTPPTGSSVATLNTQSFTTDVVYNYTNAASTAGSTTIATALDSGKWTLNGSSVIIPYMPYSANASQIIYVTNTGVQTGDISVSAYDTDGNKYDLGVVDSSEAGKLVKLGTTIYTKLQAAGFTTGKLTITINVDVPSKDVIVYASYNVGGSDRGFVNTDQLIPTSN